MFALVQNSQVVATVSTIPASSTLFPDISNMNLLDPVTLLSMGWFPLTVVNGTFDSTAYIQGAPTYQILSDQVVQTYPLTPIDPATLLANAQTQKLAQIAAWHTALFKLGFLSPTLGYMIASTRLYISTLQYKYTYMVRNSMVSMSIVAFDGTLQTLLPNQAVSVIDELSSYLDLADQNNVTLKAMVAAATTVDQVTAITPSLGAYSAPALTLAQAQVDAIIKVKGIRGNTLSLFQKKSPGVTAVYANNIDAAIQFTNNDATLMPTGQTPTAYLTGMGAHMGMTAAQFAAYIIGENIRLGAPNQTPPSAYDVECQYIASSVGIQYATTIAAVNTIVSAYQTYVAPVTGA
jgi:hypothetical protein